MPQAYRNKLVAVVLPFIMAGTLGGWLIGKLADHGITNAFIDKVSSHHATTAK